MYLYAGKSDSAYVEAKKLIDEEQSTGYFEGTSSYDVEENGNMKMMESIIFALYSPTELMEWEQAINYVSDSGTDYYLCMGSDVADQLYGDEAGDDWRMLYQLEPVYSPSKPRATRIILPKAWPVRVPVGTKRPLP